MHPITKPEMSPFTPESHFKGEAQLGTKPWEAQVYVSELSWKKSNFFFLK